jgi:hypothetical protein
VLSAIVAQFIPRFSICGRQDFATALGKNDNCQAMNFPDMITTIAGSEVTKLTCFLTSFVKVT